MRPLDEVEKEYILAALEVNQGNQTRTAEQLQIGSATLYRKLKSYGLIRQACDASVETRRFRVSVHSIDVVALTGATLLVIPGPASTIRYEDYHRD